MRVNIIHSSNPAFRLGLRRTLSRLAPLL
jgi:hypothetical protein